MFIPFFLLTLLLSGHKSIQGTECNYYILPNAGDPYFPVAEEQCQSQVQGLSDSSYKFICINDTFGILYEYETSDCSGNSNNEIIPNHFKCNGNTCTNGITVKRYEYLNNNINCDMTSNTSSNFINTTYPLIETDENGECFGIRSNSMLNQSHKVIITINKINIRFYSKTNDCSYNNINETILTLNWTNMNGMCQTRITTNTSFKRIFTDSTYTIDESIINNNNSSDEFEWNGFVFSTIILSIIVIILTTILLNIKLKKKELNCLNNIGNNNNDMATIMSTPASPNTQSNNFPSAVSAESPVSPVSPVSLGAQSNIKLHKLLSGSNNGKFVIIGDIIHQSQDYQTSLNVFPTFPQVNFNAFDTINNTTTNATMDYVYNNNGNPIIGDPLYVTSDGSNRTWILELDENIGTNSQFRWKISTILNGETLFCRIVNENGTDYLKANTTNKEFGTSFQIGIPFIDFAENIFFRVAYEAVIDNNTVEYKYLVVNINSNFIVGVDSDSVYRGSDDYYTGWSITLLPYHGAKYIGNCSFNSSVIDPYGTSSPFESLHLAIKKGKECVLMQENLNGDAAEIGGFTVITVNQSTAQRTRFELQLKTELAGVVSFGNNAGIAYSYVTIPNVRSELDLLYYHFVLNMMMLTNNIAGNPSRNVTLNSVITRITQDTTTSSCVLSTNNQGVNVGYFKDNDAPNSDGVDTRFSQNFLYVYYSGPKIT